MSDLLQSFLGGMLMGGALATLAVLMLEPLSPDSCHTQEITVKGCPNPYHDFQIRDGLALCVCRERERE